MGRGQARRLAAFQRVVAALRIGRIAGRRPRFDISHMFLRRVRVKIGVEDAAAAAKLELEAGAFANLQRRSPEYADQLGGGEADEVVALLWRLARLALRDRRLRGGGLARDTGRNQQRGGKDKTTHGPSKHRLVVAEQRLGR